MKPLPLSPEREGVEKYHLGERDKEVKKKILRKGYYERI